MTKKMAVIAVEFDDPEGNFGDVVDFATYAEIVLGRQLKDLDLTVYATPEDLVSDAKLGIGVFAENRENAGEPLKPVTTNAATSVQPLR